MRENPISYVLPLLFIVCATVVVDATAVVIFRSPERIVLAADSLIQTTAEWKDGRTERSSRRGCKIRRAGAFWYLLGGATSMLEKDDVHAVVTSSLASSRTVRDGVIKVYETVERRFHDQLTQALQESPFLSVTVAGLDAGQLVAGIFQAHLKQGVLNMGSALCPGPQSAWCHEKHDRVWFMGSAAAKGRALRADEGTPASGVGRGGHGSGAARPCLGCGQPFTPSHWRQRHCKPSCRMSALRQRKGQTPDLFTQLADAIEPDVLCRITK